MNKKKIIIILLVILIAIILFSNFISLNTIFLGNYSKVIVIGKKMIKIDRSNRIVLKKVNAYRNGKTVKGYLKSDKDDIGYSYYVVSQSNKKLDLKDLVASGTMINLEMPSSADIEANKNGSSLAEINDLLDLNLKNEELYEYKKISIDIDNDSEKEDVICAEYRYGDSSVTKVFIKDISTIEVLEYEYDITDKKSSHKTYYLSNVIDLNKDGNYEIIVGRIDGNSMPTYYDIYSYENGSIKEIK